MLQAVIFDFDGTMCPTLERQEKWFKFYSEKNGKGWNFSTFTEFMNFYNELLAQDGGVQNVYDALGLPCDMKDHSHPVWPAYEEFNQSNSSQLYPGMRRTIEEIWQMGALEKEFTRNRRLRLGINTNNSWKSIYKDLKANGVLPYFDAYVTAEVLREYQGAGDGDCIKKPSKISLAMMLGLLDSQGAYTIHVGDTLNDLRASQKVVRLHPSRPESIITVGACYGYEGRDTLEQGADGTHFDYLIDRPAELINIVQSLL